MRIPRYRLPCLVVCIVSALVLLPAQALAAGSNAVQSLAGCTDHAIAANDDGSEADVALPFVVNFFGNEFSTVNINNNGNVTFAQARGEYTPYDFRVTGEAIIAPFLADVDTRVGSLVTYGTTTVNGHTAFCVDYVDVGYYDEHADKTNSFQMLLIDEGPTAGDFVIRLNYDRIAWETGDASGGHEGFGGTSAAAGFSSGDGDAAHSLVLPGSFANGALLDGGSSALSAGTSNAGGQLGRYNFPVVNSPPTGATLEGLVKAPGGDPLVDAPVEICGPLPAATCIARFTNNLGRYRALNLGAGQYEVTARAPADGPAYGQASAGPKAVNGLGAFTQDVILKPPPGAPPPGTGITHVGESADGVPTVYWEEPLTLSTEGCIGATVSYKIVLEGAAVSTGGLTEAPAGSGAYSGVVPELYPHLGDGRVVITFDCPSSPGETIEFGIYIDPSGMVVDAGTGAPIAGATVTLLRASAENGPFSAVPSGSAVMSAANRSNPDLTDSEGHFGWDVIAGYYKVVATADSCDSAETGVLSIPPAVTDLRIGLTCAAEGGSPGSGSSQPPVAVPPSGQQVPRKHRNKHAHRRCAKHSKHKKKKCRHKKRKHHRALRLGANGGRL